VGKYNSINIADVEGNNWKIYQLINIADVEENNGKIQ
jgi:hypothetical protein